MSWVQNHTTETRGGNQEFVKGIQGRLVDVLTSIVKGKYIAYRLPASS
jgi:hypothetical protein